MNKIDYERMSSDEFYRSCYSLHYLSSSGKQSLLVLIADPSYESVQLAGKITEMGKTFDKPVYIVLNKVDEQQKELMEEAVGDKGTIIAAVMHDRGILTAGLKGEKLEKRVDAADRIIDALA